MRVAWSRESFFHGSVGCGIPAAVNEPGNVALTVLAKVMTQLELSEQTDRSAAF